MPKKENYAYLNYLKAFAAIFVVVHHALTYAELQNSNFVLEAFYTLIIHTHVPMFLCIAGYLCHQQPLGTYFKKKALRLLVPFAVFSLLKVAYSALIDSSHAHADSLVDQLINAFATGSLYWFVYAILNMYAASPLLWKMKKGNIALFIALITVSTLLEVTGINLGNILQLHLTITYACYFMGGILLQQYKDELAAIAKKRKAVLVVLASLVIAGILCFKLNYDHPMPHFLKTLLAFSSMYLFYLLARALPQNIKFLSYLGNISLQVMLFDSFFKVILFVLIPVNLLTVWPVMIINILLTCICCYIIKKIPVVRVLFGL